MAALSNASVVAKGRLSTVASAEEIDEMKEVFACFDKDSSGAVTTAELALVLKSMNKNYTESELKKIIGKFDINGTKTRDEEGEAEGEGSARTASRALRWLHMWQCRPPCLSIERLACSPFVSGFTCVPCLCVCHV